MTFKTMHNTCHGLTNHHCQKQQQPWRPHQQQQPQHRQDQRQTHSHKENIRQYNMEISQLAMWSLHTRTCLPTALALQRQPSSMLLPWIKAKAFQNNSRIWHSLNTSWPHLAQQFMEERETSLAPDTSSMSTLAYETGWFNGKSHNRESPRHAEAENVSARVNQMGELAIDDGYDYDDEDTLARALGYCTGMYYWDVLGVMLMITAMMTTMTTMLAMMTMIMITHTAGLESWAAAVLLQLPKVLWPQDNGGL